MSSATRSPSRRSAIGTAGHATIITFAPTAALKSAVSTSWLVGTLPLLLIGLSFILLSIALRVIPMAVAYAVWGGAGLVITAIIGALVFGQRIRPVGWVGILLVVCGVVALKMV